MSQLIKKQRFYSEFRAVNKDIMTKIRSIKGERPSLKKTNNESKKQLAYFLFMQNTPQKDIASRVGVTEKTIGKWKADENWEVKRAAKAISMDELVTKALQRINELLDSQDFNADSFAKAVAQLKALKTSNTIDDEVTTFLSFQNFIIKNRINEGLSEDFIKEVVRQQDNYIQIRLGNG